ncbi:uncharacterized protein [Palaemon carinicauda]|uniref:uncharacterized protein n=1 Tax=Palaemon carinicauda TaxID=392227 RepID=UPI0035B5BAF3
MKISNPFQRLSKFMSIQSFLIVLTVALPFVCSLVTYTFVSLPDNSIALDQTGALLLLLVLFKIFILGSLGTFPIDLNAFFHKRRGRRAARHLLDGALVDDLPCTVRILCELETAARTALEDPMDEIEELHEVLLARLQYITAHYAGAVIRASRASSRNPNKERKDCNSTSTQNTRSTPKDILTSNPNDLGPGSLLVLSHFDGMTGAGQCEIAYTRCPGRISPKDAIGILLKDFDIQMHS